MTVGELDDRMSVAELLHWQAFFVIEKEETDREAKKGAQRSASDDED